MYCVSKKELSTSYLLSNREPLIGLNDSKSILNVTKGPSQTHLESMWNHSKPSQVPYFSTKYFKELLFGSTNTSKITITTKKNLS